MTDVISAGQVGAHNSVMVMESQTIAEIAVNLPGASRVFESHHIDYCCGGERTLREACDRAQASLQRVMADLDALAPGELRNWASLTTLVAHVIDTHHVYARAAMSRIAPLAEKVRRAHDDNHPELSRVVQLFDRLCGDLGPHMRAEEGTLFPAILQMARPGCSRSVRDALRMSIKVMHHDHDAVGRILVELREVTASYEPPDDACTTYRALYRELEAFEADLHEHMHLENNVLLPRALAAEHNDDKKT
jgi:regulator of cell morphogenesis and NO signaling